MLQARDASGDPIFTMMNLADHNQDIGHSDTYEESHAVSGDWPGYFHHRLEQDWSGGMAMFLAGDIGSMEDLITDPAIPDPPCNSGANGCFAQVRADRRHDRRPRRRRARPGREPVRPGPVDGRRTEFCVPLENNLFRAALRGGTLRRAPGLHELPAEPGRVGNEVHTSVAVLDVGPDLQFIVNPGRGFPRR